jgi:hypothetical protein
VSPAANPGLAPVFVLVHSPLVGPSTWHPVARELEGNGRVALVPSLVDVARAPAPQWQHVCRAVRAGTEHVLGPVTLAGHSGAGLLLPTIAERLASPIAAMLFVDTFLPPPAGTVALAEPEFLDDLRARARGGILPPWHRWFGEHALRALVPDDATRARLEAETPRLPISYFEDRPPVPERWDRRPCAYLLLSEQPYAAAAEDARARGWPTAALGGAHHLSLVTDARAVMGALLDLERALVKPHESST